MTCCRATRRPRQSAIRLTPHAYAWLIQTATTCTTTGQYYSAEPAPWLPGYSGPVQNGERAAEPPWRRPPASPRTWTRTATGRSAPKLAATTPAERLQEQADTPSAWSRSRILTRPEQARRKSRGPGRVGRPIPRRYPAGMNISAGTNCFDVLILLCWEEDVCVAVSVPHRHPRAPEVYVTPTPDPTATTPSTSRIHAFTLQSPGGAAEGHEMPLRFIGKGCNPM